jgi:N12 class adenine-specific DNA methylase
MAFSDDSGYPLLCSLEVINNNGELERKADIFTKRTIKPYSRVEKADTPQEALAASIGELARVDFEYMSSILGGMPREEIITSLKGRIFENPVTAKWETADGYLSGDVKHKLKVALYHAEKEPERYGLNVEALKEVQPKDLTAAEISINLGATWVPEDIMNQFMYETFNTPKYLRNTIKISYSPINGLWNVSGKRSDSHTNVLTNMTYGTNRINGYEILQSALNLKDVKIFDVVSGVDGDKRVLNQKETILAQQKQQTLKEAFKNWIYKEPERRERIVRLYNDIFNNIVPRQYKGDNIKFHGINPEISLRPHQKNALARIIYGGNTLLAHCVGAGKTFEMTAAAMELKALGLCNKSMFVVPNHLTEQWAGEFLQLYPAANILVATKKDFEASRRKRFCSRIATGEYDAVIIGHSQFEKIPVSKERQIEFIDNQISEILMGIDELKREKGENFAIKQMEFTKKKLQEKLEKIKDEKRKDNVVNFEELGIDRIFVDEAHYYKNLFLYTKMRNVAGIGQTDAKKSSDLYIKCRYLDKITNGKGVIFATGTPVSNSITELYTMMRYLQNSLSEKRGQKHFDCWAADYGESVTALELAPEGTGYRLKTRFAKFNNIPEMIMAFKECADIQTADMLKLPVPKAVYKIEVTKPTEFQKEIVKGFGARAEKIRKGNIDPKIDNMLKITNDGRKLALDQRLQNILLPDAPNSKVNRCVDNILQIWKDTAENKSAQLVFCDLSTPAEFRNNSEEYVFTDIYNDLLYKLKNKGIPEKEIAFIHTANTETKKNELFAKVRSGEVRVLIGSTFKMGAGTNVQSKLIALHHIDVPWRPADIEQREGRIIRQGNENETVYIYRYVTENTFDAYSWQLLEQKQKFISQLMNGSTVKRSCDDIDSTALSFAELKALSAGDPRIKEKMDLDVEVSRLQLLKNNYDNEKYRLEDDVLKNYPRMIEESKENISGLEADIQIAKANEFTGKNEFLIKVNEVVYIDKKQGAEMLLSKITTIDTDKFMEIGKYRGFLLKAAFDGFTGDYKICICGKKEYKTELGSDSLGNITRLNNLIDKIPELLEKEKSKLEGLKSQIENAKKELEKPFDREEELKEKTARLEELNGALKLSEATPEIIAEPEEKEIKQSQKSSHER